MRTVNDLFRLDNYQIHIVVFIVFAVAGFSFVASTAFATETAQMLANPAPLSPQTVAPVAAPSSGAPPTLPAVANVPTQPSAPGAPQAGVVMTPGPVSPVPTSPTGTDIKKSITAMEDKTIENAKNVVKRLDTTSDATTIADLNIARQTVTRIEAMIDVEKRLAELDKLRNDHNSGSSSMTALAAAIPASALAPPMPSHFTPAADRSHEQDVPVHMPSLARPEITRIFGTEGQYSAVLKMAGGDTKTVRVGDQIGTGSTVRSITSSSVMIESKGESYTLHVKNVDVVYSAMR